MSCAKTQFPEFSFCGPHTKPHGVRLLSKHYRLQLYPKFGHGKCATRKIPCACISLTTILEKPWDYKVDHRKHLYCQPVVGCTYWTLVGSFNNCNIIQFINKTPSSEEFDTVHKVVIYGISDNMAYLVQLGKYSAIHTADPTTMGYYVRKYLYEPYTL